jgi:hypothetical protein
MDVCMHFQHRGSGLGESVTSAACKAKRSRPRIPAKYDRSGIGCNPLEGAGTSRKAISD